LPVPEKKPPLPTVNRVIDQKNVKNIPQKYVPPRNKNEVTGKVTETSVQKGRTKQEIPRMSYSINKNDSKKM
jgi:hypothetical protein